MVMKCKIFTGTDKNVVVAEVDAFLLTITQTRIISVHFSVSAGKEATKLAVLILYKIA